MAVYQDKKTGRWFVYGRKGFWPDDPERIREYFGVGLKARELAEKRNAQLLAAKRKAKRATSPFFHEVAIEYLEEARSRMTNSTLQSVEYLIGSHLIPAFGDIPADAITEDHVRTYIRLRLIRDHVRRTTVNSEITYLKAILNWAASIGRISHNPIRDMAKPPRDDEIIQPPTIEECRKILAVAPEHLYRALLIVWYTGIRPGAIELLRLRYHDIDWTAKTLRATSARKGGPVSRTIPIHDDLMQELRKWHRKDGDQADYIITWHGKPVRSLKTAFRSAKKAAGITRRMRLYDFRHAAITNMLLGGADPRTVSDLAGHSRPDTTLRIYTHSNIRAKRKAINTIKPLLKNVV